MIPVAGIFIVGARQAPAEALDFILLRPSFDRWIRGSAFPTDGVPRIVVSRSFVSFQRRLHSLSDRFFQGLLEFGFSHG
ncbi:MAG TPA: hypothetical protein VK961_01680 [Chthoniobacter sp.]|nr:hypothetical protein [Chthoniobacter sp.]